MVKIQDIRISNAKVREQTPGKVSVFIGATSGIGLGTLKALAKNAKAPKVYFTGRSRSAANPLIKELESLNPDATFIFIETQVSLIKQVDIVSDQIKSKESKIDLLFLNAGALSMNGRQETSEGLDTPLAVAYYSRIRFILNLLPLLKNSASPRVVSVLAAGKEAPLILDDLELKDHYSLPNAANHTATMTSLSFDVLAAANPKVSFVHFYPGLVSSPLLKKTFAGISGPFAIFGKLANWFVVPVLHFFAQSVDEAGERGLFVGTSARYDLPNAEVKGVELPAGVNIGRNEAGADGQLGFYRVDWDVENAKENTALDQLRKDGKAPFVYEKTLEVFDRILSQ